MLLAHKKANTEESLEEHTYLVCKYIKEMCTVNRMPEYTEKAALLVAILHDLGKCSSTFQKYIRGEEKTRYDHSIVGALVLLNKLKCDKDIYFVIGKRHYSQCLLASVVAGHHAGLPDTVRNTNGIRSIKERTIVASRIRFSAEEVQSMVNFLQNVSSVIDGDVKLPTVLEQTEGDSAKYAAYYSLKMIYSLLIDADRLATEEFFRCKRDSTYLSMGELLHSFDTFYKNNFGAVTSELNAERTRIKQKCDAASSMDKGIFSLPVPTGGGKTLSSMSFALRHAALHGMSRIIIVTPFTTVTEQTASVLRSIFGDIVLEHQSAVVNWDNSDAERRFKLAAENWDVPIIVTTSVQFFESIHANKPSRLRKVHNIANSVVILDEVQSIPTHILEPSLAALRELSTSYHTSVVLCSATIPPYTKDVVDVRVELNNTHPIIENHAYVYKKFDRNINVVMLENTNLDVLAEQSIQHENALIICNSKRCVLDLYNRIKTYAGTGTQVYHLSTNMCPAHRQAVLQKVVMDLRNGGKCIVVATSLIEAGIDIDFSTVYREKAGVDSIVQSAGRCNREMKRNGGTLFVFSLEDEYAVPNVTKLRLAITDGLNVAGQDLLDIGTIERYFRVLYTHGLQNADGRRIVEYMEKCYIDIGSRVCYGYEYATIAKMFTMIKDSTYSIVVPYKDGANFIDRLCCGANTQNGAVLSKSDIRKMSQFVVNVYKGMLDKLVGAGIVSESVPGIYVCSDSIQYDNSTGLVMA